MRIVGVDAATRGAQDGGAASASRTGATAAKARELEANRHAAGAEERAARARREQITAEQQAQKAERAEAEDLRSRADELDPDTK